MILTRIGLKVRFGQENGYAQSTQHLRKPNKGLFQLDRTMGTMCFRKVGRTDIYQNRYYAKA